jgi:hypothetical protein
MKTNIKHRSRERIHVVSATWIGDRSYYKHSFSTPEIKYKKKIVKESHGILPVKKGTLHASR